MFSDRYEIHRWFLWMPVGLALGIASYFALSFEPETFPTLLNGCLGIILLWFILKLIHRKLRQDNISARQYDVLLWSVLLIQIIIASILGFSSAKIRTLVVNTPPFSETIKGARLNGFVESIEDVPRGTFNRQKIIRRVVLSHLTGLPFPVDPSIQIRIQGLQKRLSPLQIFQKIQLTADISPPPYPLTENGYDSPFDMYFKGISGLGKLKDITLKTTPVLGVALHEHVPALRIIQKLRFFLTNQIHLKLGPSCAPVASSLITGDKSGITLQVRENFTRAGLSHMLAISGLHMGLLAGLAFFLFSKVLVLIPHLATRFIVKKIAALLTLPFTFFYLLLSGGSFSALRSFIMVSLSMLAILIDQHPISLRCTAIAASLILLLFPESLYSISFQLSFASVTGLCYFYESHRITRIQNPQKQYFSGLCLLSQNIKGSLIRLGIRITNPILQSIISTFIATLVTLPITIYSFQRLTLVGVLGNILAIPLLSFWVLPIGVLAVLSLIKPGGIDFLFWFWGVGLKGLLKIAEWIASMPGSDCSFAKPTSWSVVLIVLTVLWMMIWHGKKRWLGAPLLGISIAVFFLYNGRPDIFVTQNGKIIGAVDSNQHQFLISNPHLGSFHAKVWSQECGIAKVTLMSKEQANSFATLVHPFLRRSHFDDVIFLKKNAKKSLFFQKNLCFHQKKRPWYQR